MWYTVDVTFPLFFLLSKPIPSHLRPECFIYPLCNQASPFPSLLIYVYAIPHRSAIYWSPYTIPCWILCSSPALPTVWSDNPGYLMLTKRPASAIGCLHSTYKTREYGTCNLVSDILSLVKSLCSSVALPALWSDTSSYLVMTVQRTCVTGG